MPESIDHVAFDDLALQHRGTLVHYLGRLVGDADAEDVVQIALIKAAGALEGFRGEASPKNWLFRIATNAALDFLRSRGEHAPAPLPSDDEEDAADAGVDAAQERRLLRQEMSTCVRGVMQRLPEGHQTILALSDCEELADRDIAAVLGITPGAAKIRLHRARARLKTELERECTFYRDPENTLCCDRKAGNEEIAPSQKNSSTDPYLSTGGLRHQVERRENSDATPTQAQESDMLTETLPTKQKHLIGVGAAVAAGCQPCTTSFVSAAREAGACERGARHALETGARIRQAADKAMRTFIDARFPNPVLDQAFLADRGLLESLTAVAAALASNAAGLVKESVLAARKLGATEAQIRMAGQIAQTARRGAEKEADAALEKALGCDPATGCCDEKSDGCVTGSCDAPAAPKASACGCGNG